MNKIASSDKNPVQTRGTPGIWFPALFGLRWMLELASEWSGLSEFMKTALVIGLFCVALIVIILIDELLARAGVQGSIRAGLWSSAVLGPVVSFESLSQWGHPVWAQVLGFASSVLMFGTIYLISKRRWGI